MRNKNGQTGKETESLPGKKPLVTHLNTEWIL